MSVRVKKLEWRGSADWGWWTADTTFPGRWYHIVREDTDSLRPFVHRADWLPGPEMRFETLERAINFANLHHTDLILSALDLEGDK